MPCKEEDDEVNSRTPRFFCAKMYNKILTLPNSKLQATCAEENSHPLYLYIFNNRLIHLTLN